MKKQLLLMLMMLMSIVASADDSGSCGENVTYTYVEATHTLTLSGTGEMTDYNPLNGDPAPWSSYQNNITSIIIKEGITSIGQGAFRNCSILPSIVVPKSVTSIKRQAFYNCKQLSSIEIPESVLHIEDQAFHLTAWYNKLPDGVVYAGKVAYNYKGEMPENTTLVIKEGTSVIAEGAFRKCANLTLIEIPNSISIIEDYAFEDCSGLTTITIGNGLKSIGEYAFQGCRSIKELSIPQNVTSIGKAAFYGCESITEVTIPESITSIEPETFWYCTSLASISIPEGVTSIGRAAFDNTTWFNNQPDGMVYIGKVAYKYKGIMPNNTEIVIKDGTLGIAGNAFQEYVPGGWRR